MLLSVRYPASRLIAPVICLGAEHPFRSGLSVNRQRDARQLRQRPDDFLEGSDSESGLNSQECSKLGVALPPFELTQRPRRNSGSRRQAFEGFLCPQSSDPVTQGPSSMRAEAAQSFPRHNADLTNCKLSIDTTRIDCQTTEVIFKPRYDAEARKGWLMKASSWLYRRFMGLARRHDGFANPAPRLRELDEFIGRWVAVKDGHVVAAAESSKALVYEVHKLGTKGKGAVVQFVPPPSRSSMVGVG